MYSAWEFYLKENYNSRPFISPLTIDALERNDLIIFRVSFPKSNLSQLESEYFGWVETSDLCWSDFNI